MRISGTSYGYLVAVAIAAGEGGVGVLLPPYLTSLGFGAPVVGLFVAIYAIACLLSRGPGGRWYRPGLVRPLIAGSLVLVIGANLLYPWTGEGVVLGVLRLLGSMGFGLGTTVNLAQFIDTLSPYRSRERAMSYYAAAMAGGFMLGNGLGGFFSDRFGYAAGFAVAAVPALLVAALSPLATEPAAVREARPGGQGPRALLAAMGEPLLFVVLVEAFVLNFLFGLHYAYSPLYFLSVGATLGVLGLLRALFSFTQVLSRLGSGWLFARFGYRRVAAAMLGAQVLAVALIPTTSSLVALAGLAVFYGAARGIMMVANTIGLAEASDQSRVGRGAASGLYNAATDLGSLVGPILAGVLVEVIGLGPMFVAAPIGLLVAYWLVLWWGIRRAPPALAPAEPAPRGAVQSSQHSRPPS